MPQLENHLKIDKETTLSPNLTQLFSEKDLVYIGNCVWEGYEQDEFSRSAWRSRTQRAMDLALQLQEERTFPWPNASNVAFPLVTIAALQFHSRAYPAVVSGPEIVKCRVIGQDPEGVEAARAARIGAHMSYQALEGDASWEEQHDRLLINLPIVGCAFKKTYHSSLTSDNKSELVLAQDLVMDYYAKSVESCRRKTHIIPLYRNEMYSQMVLGVFQDYTEETWFQSTAKPLRRALDEREDARTGSSQPKSDPATPFTTLEQHCWLDLDGDGFDEPYVVTIESDTKKVLRIVARWDRIEDVQRTNDGRIYQIDATEYFTKYSLIPNPDGGIYDIGFGILLGPLNESVNTLINQLIDAGTMATTAGGFLSRGTKIRGGNYSFSPFEWKRVDSTGEDLSKGIFPLPVREPSNVLFQLLSLLINYTERISGSTDVMVGENVGQNTAKGTVDQLVEQGSKIYSAIFKRVWRSMKEEFKKAFRLNAIYLPTERIFGAAGLKVLREDYLTDPNRVVPACDPTLASDAQRTQQAIMLKQAAATTPGYNVEAVERRFLSAIQVDGVELLYPGPSKVPQGEDLKITLKKLDLEKAALELRQQQQQFVMSLMEQQRLNTAKILQLTADATKLMGEAETIEQGKQLALLNQALESVKAQDEAIRSRIELNLKAMEVKQNAQQQPAAAE